uniref:DUF1248 domain-containing protein n=2 Tax=Caenorhabditis tropicalis TaxID=1561998 RepID=A0A1I7UYG9_9PELO
MLMYRMAIRRSSQMTKLTRADVDFVTNPGEKYMDQFMKVHGNDRTVFKKSDIAQWQASFDDYKFKLTCLKNTEKVIATSHVCRFYPIKPLENDPIYFMGFDWIHPEYRSPAVAKIQNLAGMEDVEDPKNDNIVSQINEPGRKFWHLMCGMKEYPDIGHRTGDVGYRSFYNVSDMKMDGSGGEIIDSSGITIRNARDVPKRDIIEYDQRIHPYHREKYIISHMLDRDGFAKVAYSDKDGKVCGIGQSIIYENKMDCNIGPLYADEPRVAQTIFSHMLNDIQQSGKKVLV